METDKKENPKQRRERYLKGDYVLAEIIVSRQEPSYPNIMLDKKGEITLNELVILYATLGEIRKDLIKKRPEILIANNFYDFKLLDETKENN